MNSVSRYLPFVAAMALVVVASNILVQFPMQGQIGGLSLADILTWGAFTYPFSFLVTDLANRRYGPTVARRIVFVGFMTAVICSILVPPFLFRHGLIEFETAADRQHTQQRRRLQREAVVRAGKGESGGEGDAEEDDGVEHRADQR
ncbi:queuosine precursor transporter, partial [Mesorhizobium sp.]|uniref:queuosine precursor transporter n=1 Tax=Mesorhizobium sp. TaxID=1871066 RepID=UPI0025C3CDB6